MKRIILFVSMFAVLCLNSAEAVVGNPISALIGRPVCDQHIVEWKGRLYMFASHDFSPDGKNYEMRDWWVWSSDDLLQWRLESVLKPEDTFLKRPFNSCWATFGIPFPDGWRYYFSAGPREIGVVIAETPAGPWRDPLGKPLVVKGQLIRKRAIPISFAMTTVPHISCLARSITS